MNKFPSSHNRTKIFRIVKILRLQANSRKLQNSFTLKISHYMVFIVGVHLIVVLLSENV